MHSLNNLVKGSTGMKKRYLD